MIFLDTSGILAAADARDANWQEADAGFRYLSEQGTELLTHSYVVVEAASLIQRRISLEASLRFLSQVRLFKIHWITEVEHDSADALLRSRSRRHLSLTDTASFIVMRRYGVDEAFSFDRDFEREGFRLFRAPRP